MRSGHAIDPKTVENFEPIVLPPEEPPAAIWLDEDAADLCPADAADGPPPEVKLSRDRPSPSEKRADSEPPRTARPSDRPRRPVRRSPARVPAAVRPVLVLGVATAAFLVLWQALGLVLGGRLHAILFDRGPLQAVTAYLAVVAAALLADRAMTHLRTALRFRCTRDRESGVPEVPEDLARQLDDVRDAVRRQGTGAAVPAARHAADRHRSGVRRGYSVVYLITCTLPAVGLLGTMTAVSSALGRVAADGVVGPAAVGQVLAALGTGLDLAILAVALAVPLAVATRLLARSEEELAERYADYVRREFRLDGLESGGRPADGLRREFRSLARRLAGDARGAFHDVLQDAADGCRDDLGEALTAHGEALRQSLSEALARRDEQDGASARRLAEVLGGAMGRLTDQLREAIAANNARLVEGVVSQLAPVQQALRDQAPRELVFRYQPAAGDAPGGNGAEYVAEPGHPTI